MINRKKPVHGVKIEFDSPTIVFVTVCTKSKKRWLATDEVHKTLVSIWGRSEDWRVGRYVLMPDHLHLFASPVQIDSSLESWVRYWKAHYSRCDYNPDHRWQDSHWDRRIRSDESYEQKWGYVRNNPLRAGLVSNPDEWPFQGELNILRW